VHHLWSPTYVTTYQISLSSDEKMFLPSLRSRNTKTGRDIKNSARTNLEIVL